MPYSPNPRVAGLSDPKTQAVSRRAKQLIAQGVSVFNFTAGEPHEPPTFFRHRGTFGAIVQLLSNPALYRYSDVRGRPDLRQEVAKYFGVTTVSNDFTENDVLITHGTKGALSLLCKALLGVRTNSRGLVELVPVIVPTPYWVSYPEIVRLEMGDLRRVETDASSGFKLTASALSAIMAEYPDASRPVVLILNSPHNPTGAVYSEEEMRALAGAISHYPNLFVVEDVIYSGLAYHGQRSVTLYEFASEELRERLALVSGVAKAFGAPGLRVGFVASRNAELMRLLAAIQGHQLGNVNELAQFMAHSLLKEGPEYLGQVSRTYQHNAVSAFDLSKAYSWSSGLSLAAVPQGSLFAWLQMSPELQEVVGTGDALSERLLAGGIARDIPPIAVLGGDSFGDPGSIRVSFACDQDSFTEGFEKLHQATVDLLRPSRSSP